MLNFRPLGPESFPNYEEVVFQSSAEILGALHFCHYIIRSIYFIPLSLFLSLTSLLFLPSLSPYLFKILPKRPHHFLAFPRFEWSASRASSDFFITLSRYLKCRTASNGLSPTKNTTYSILLIHCRSSLNIFRSAPL